MKKIKMVPLFTVFFALLALLLCLPAVTYAHCDGLDGPVVAAAKEALESGKVTPVLIWVQKKDEQTIKDAFNKTLAVRKLDPKVRELADMYFFETLVRVHRAGVEPAFCLSRE
jgi:phosphotransacetylase